jgi:hypothetical protein
MGDRLIKTNYVDVEASVEIYFSDIMDSISELNKEELIELYDEVCEELGYHNIVRKPATLNDVMKEEWWEEASKKLTLEQLEEKFGTKYDLM